jgi:hypothetical protein
LALRTLFSECPTEVDTYVHEVNQSIAMDDRIARDYLELLVGAVQSAARLSSRLAEDETSATQYERNVMRVVAEIRRDFLDRASPLSANATGLNSLLSRLQVLAGQLPITRLKREWPVDVESPRLLHSIYRAGDMLAVLEFLLEKNNNEALTILMAHCDYIHLKLLEILRRNGRPVRLMCAEEHYELLRRFQSLADVISVSPKLHCRISAADSSTLISSADLNVESYTTHIEAGVSVDVRNERLKPFVDSIWSHGVPLSSYSKGLASGPYSTTHVLLTQAEPGLLSGGYSFEALARDVSSEVHRILTYHHAAGYVESDKSTGSLFINLRTVDNSVVLRDEIANICSMQFRASMATIPVESVFEAARSMTHVERMAAAFSPLTILLFADGLENNVANESKSFVDLLGFDYPDIHSVGFSLKNHRIVKTTKERVMQSPPRFLILLHYGVLVAASRPFTTDDVEKELLWGLFQGARRPRPL